MKAVLLYEYGGPDKLKYEDVSDPVAKENQVLVRVAATSVNPIDYKMRSGAMKNFFPLELPAILGRDVAGIVREVGPGITNFKPGDKVMALGTRTYAEQTVVQANDLALVPDKLDLVKAAALPVVTPLGTVDYRARRSGWSDGSRHQSGWTSVDQLSGQRRRPAQVAVANQSSGGAWRGPGFSSGRPGSH